MSPRIAELCAGYGGLSLAIELVLGGELAFVADNDPGASLILSHRYPGIPNLGDITTVEWELQPRPDILAAGFPCFAAGTLILTRRGYLPIEDVTVGDLVLTHTGRWKPVTATMARDDAPLWQLKGANPIVTTAEHPFYTRLQGRIWNNERRRYDRTFGTPEWTAASRVIPWKHRVGHVLPPVEQPAEADGSWWWMAGRFLADGYRQQRKKTGGGNPVLGDQGRVVICCGGGKEEELRKHLNLAGLHATEAQERTVIKFHIVHQGFYRFCEQFGRGAANKHLPAAALSLPPDLAEELLAGFLSGDGHRNSTGWHGTTTSKALALGLVMLAHRARGVAASLSYQETAPTTVIEGRTVNQRPWWRVCIPYRNRRGLVEGDYAWRFAIGSEPLETTGRVHNLSVADDESYIADGLIVHNCQDVSCAGARAGLREGNRTGVWAYVARAIDILRPPLIVLENVRGLLSAGADSDLEFCPWCLGEAGDEHALRASGAVLGDLADLGYDARWAVVSAADAGAPHRRERVFICARPAADAAGIGAGEPADEALTIADGGNAWSLPGGRGLRVAADSNSRGPQGTEPAGATPGRKAATTVGRRPADEHCPAAADTNRGRLGSAEQHLLPGQSDADRIATADPRGSRLGQHPGEPSTQEAGPLSGDEPSGDRGLRPAANWGPYEPAIRRWELVTGRPTPRPTEPGRSGERLSPAFVEFLMGLPEGWVTDVPGLSRNAQLRALGNGVVPQQCALALRLLLADLIPATAFPEAAAS